MYWKSIRLRDENAQARTHTQRHIWTLLEVRWSHAPLVFLLFLGSYKWYGITRIPLGPTLWPYSNLIVSHTSMGPLQLLMYISWLHIKLRPMMNMAFLTHLWCSFNTLKSTLEGGTFLDPSTTITQRLAKTISILNF
jgi:hypothetical protein